MEKEVKQSVFKGSIVRYSVFLLLAVALLLATSCAQKTVNHKPAPDGSGTDASDSTSQDQTTEVLNETEDQQEEEQEENITSPSETENSTEPAEDLSKDSDLNLSGKVKDGVRVVEVKAFQYGYSPDPIKVKKGVPLKLKVTSTDVKHGFSINTFKIREPVEPGETTTIEFTPHKIGEFQVYCHIQCGIGHAGMKGEFWVMNEEGKTALYP